MNSFDLMFTDEERRFVKERYPAADLDNLNMPVMGLASISSMEYLESSLKSDIETGNFADCLNPSGAMELAMMIRKKIRSVGRYEKRRGGGQMLSPQEYIRQFSGCDLDECISERDNLFEEIRQFEKDPIFDDDEIPCALSRYQVHLDYLKELNDIIARKICELNPAFESKSLSVIELKNVSITRTGAQAVVNAANSSLRQGSGVCGAIFAAAGPERLQKECDEIGHCETGKAVITSGYDLSDYIIHAVGPIYQEGNTGQADQLYSCYMNSLKIARENSIRSIAFPLISAGIYGYPKDEAWKIALKACDDWIEKNQDYEIRIIFAIIDEKILELGKRIAEQTGINVEC